jgi:hypothetical protein
MSPELDLQLQEFLTYAQPFMLFIFSVCLLKFVWTICKLAYKFLKITW